MPVAGMHQRTVLVDVLERVQQRCLPCEKQGGGECGKR